MSDLIVHNLSSIPKDYRYDYRDLDTLDEYDVKNIQQQGIDEVWYWYATGSYDGSGQLLMRKDSTWDLHDMGHCSCYGPTDQLNFVPHGSLEELEKNLSDDLKSEVVELFAAARSEGWT